MSDKSIDFDALAASLIARAREDGEQDLDPTEERDRWAAKWRASRHKAIEVGGVPAAICKLLRGPLADTRAMSEARATVDARTSIVFVGGVGAGKSTAAGWVLLEHGGDFPGWINATELERHGRYDREFSGWLFGRSALVVDDLGVEPLDGKGYFIAMIDEIVEAFTGSQRRCVITTNVSPAKLVDRYGDRVWSRWTEHAAITLCGDVDLRGKR